MSHDSSPPLSTAQAILAACLVTLDEGSQPLSGRELDAIIERRKAQMTFIRAKAAELGGLAATTEDDWAAASLWVQSALPNGFSERERERAKELVAAIPRIAWRKALEVVSAVVQWDGVTTDGEFAWLDALARAARLDDRASLDDLRRVGQRLARAR